MRALQRREVLQLGAASVATALIGAGCGPGDAGVGPPVLAIDLDRLLERYFDAADPADVSRIGEVVTDGLANRGRLADELNATLELLEGVETLERGLAVLEARVGADYDELRLQDVDGWILSRTEATLCVLSHQRAGTS